MLYADRLAFDLYAERPEPVNEVFIAAFYLVHIPDETFTARTAGGNNERHPRTYIGRNQLRTV